MLTGRAAELRPDINYLAPRVTVLVRPEDATQPWAANGEYAGLLRAWSRTTNVRRMWESKARNAGRAIPTSGGARRRAKAHRNRGLCLERHGDGRCPNEATASSSRCRRHHPSSPTAILEAIGAL